VATLSRFTEKVKVLRTSEDMLLRWAKPYGDVLVAERLWKDLGLESTLKGIDSERDNEFSLERAVFCMVYDRLVNPGSKLSLSEKLSEKYFIGGSEGLELQHLYRSLDILYENKEMIEENLFSRHRDIFNFQFQPELVFFDTTSSYFEGSGKGSDLKEYGYSRDKRPDRKQIVVGILITREGVPIACRVFPGNTADPKTIKPVLDDLRNRFRVRRVMFICDKGMISEENMRLMASAGYDYIVGARMSSHHTRETLSRPGRYHRIEREGKPDLMVKEAIIDGERYIVCYNPEEAERDRAMREEIIMKLEQGLATDPKSLINNKGYRRFLKSARGSFEIDYEKVKEAEGYDGKYVIKVSDPKLTSESAALAYRELWRIERAFRTLKSSLEIRPMYHWTDRRIEAHVFVCFLALVMARELELRLNKGIESDDERITAEKAIEALGSLKAVKVEIEGGAFIARTEINKEVSAILRTLGIREPHRIVRVCE
ncbi:MAG: IS1634 family transposase, partial [candidate division WOR-3 bacterium]